VRYLRDFARIEANKMLKEMEKEIEEKNKTIEILQLEIKRLQIAEREKGSN